ncbi:metal-binding protein [Leptolyngbya sp. AN03gr2]|uniref:metal-binding protein n=1 Tax=unclassified Leptolyngbya TaxID=2650499 RepID=UPI003D31B0B8
MPNGKTHDLITLASSPIIAVGSTAILQSIVPTASILTSAALTTAGFLFAGLMLSPDLDLHSRPYKRWKFLRWIWIPYQKALSHRSFWSHGPLVGTSLRVLYLSLWIAGFIVGWIVLWSLFESLSSSHGDWIKMTDTRLRFSAKALIDAIVNHIPEVLTIGVGLELGSASHYLADWISTIAKRLKKSRSSWK